MSEEWKKQDRECAPCVDCGAALYERFWGGGGWAKTDKTTDHAHGPGDCVRALKAELAEAKRSLSRWQTGTQIEGDYVPPDAKM